ncbi:MAG TPA: MraY family glycosyltransferase [Candidatus Woesebacteria bacterium]|jgi:UDP-GlcNAc:undecaprenyl-phosphate GlcNAc-1-phosphate transferase|nr:undecaprenyl/decaprenyl-phosphate alpha-N-acetylglucosaminyl 1-phosphate transferase [Candidatus Shapirobacteria bacterium]HOR01943.1 MraY family glycosyltransferase [Candidatus Woesebacteria bacterium]
MTFFFISILIAFVISFILTPVVRNFFISRGWIEDPVVKDKKTHNATAISAVPRGGGIPIFIAVTITSLLLLPLDKHLIGILIAALVSLIVGVWDDIKDISPLFRFLANILTALIVVGSGIGIAYISNPISGGVFDLSFLKINFNFLGNHSIWVISDLIAIIWIVWCMNIVGWATGVDGQLPGFTAISAFFIGLIGFRYSADITQWPVIILSGAVCGAYLGFLPFNFFPQSIMPGYSGKSLAGFFLAVLSILSGAKMATLLFLLAIPMIDAVYTIIRRLIQRRPIYLGDGQHFHHQLLKHGFSRRSIALIYWAFSLVLGLISLFLNSSQKAYVFIGFALLFFSFLFRFSRRN